MTTSAVNLPWFYWVIDTHRLKCMRFATETRLARAELGAEGRACRLLAHREPMERLLQPPLFRG